MCIPTYNLFYCYYFVLTGIIAGGVTGAILAAILTALIIIMWQKKGDREYIQGQQTYRDEIVV